MVTDLMGWEGHVRGGTAMIAGAQFQWSCWTLNGSLRHESTLEKAKGHNKASALHFTDGETGHEILAGGVRPCIARLTPLRW